MGGTAVSMLPLDKVLVTLLSTLDKTALLFTIVSEVLALVTALLVKVVLLFTIVSEVLLKSSKDDLPAFISVSDELKVVVLPTKLSTTVAAPAPPVVLVKSVTVFVKSSKDNLPVATSPAVVKTLDILLTTELSKV